MLGLIRLVDYLSQPSNFGTSKRVRIVVDCGTGTTAVGLALGIALHRYSTILLHLKIDSLLMIQG